MRGIELPINVLVVVAIAVIVLLGVVVLYLIGWGPFSGGVSLMSLKNVGCSNFSINYRCGAGGMTVDNICLPQNSYLTSPCSSRNTNASNLENLCRYYFNATLDADCRALCNCA